MKIHRSLAVALGVGLVAPIALSGAAGADQAPDPVTAAARDWLVSQQQADGGFEVVGFPGFETTDAVLALAAVAQSDGFWDGPEVREVLDSYVTDGGKRPLDALDDLIDADADPTAVAAAARGAKITALVAQPLGIDASDFDPSGDSADAVDLFARIAARQQPDGTLDFGAQFNGLLYAVIALAGDGQTVSTTVLDQIRAAQRPDGSWDYTGTTDADGEDIDTTALALIALRSAGVAGDDADVVAAVGWLASKQQASGAWQAFGGDDVNSTALASIALSDLRIDVTTSAWRSAAGSPASGTYVSPYAWLRSQQDDDGHIISQNDGFGVNTFATSQAVQALDQQWFIEGERRELVDEWSKDLASPANAPVGGLLEVIATDVLGPNTSIRSARLAAANVVVASQPAREAAANDLFQAAFGRNLDPSGRAYWSNQLRTLSRPEVLARLTGSSEYYRKAGSTIPGFVDKVYGSVLGRAADPSGRAYWIRQLENGRSVQAVARTLTASSEYRRKEVRAAFVRVLDRQPDAGELTYWTNKTTTTRIEVLLATLAASAERYGSLEA